MKLENIGFYTLHDQRVRTTGERSPLTRCELVLSSRCNFNCPYCRKVGGSDIPFEQATKIIESWTDQGLFAIRFSGGEPTLYQRLSDLVSLARSRNVRWIAVSTNGSADLKLYQQLQSCGVNDFSVSLDACCAEDGDKMAGGVKGAWGKVIRSIEALSKSSYVTVGGRSHPGKHRHNGEDRGFGCDLRSQ